MEAIKSDERWRHVPVAYSGRALPQTEGFALGGLLVVNAYDHERGDFPQNAFEIWHHPSGEFMLEVRAAKDRVLDITAELAAVTDWALLTTTDQRMLRAKLDAFALQHPGEIAAYRWVAANELEQLVPFG